MTVAANIEAVMAQRGLTASALARLANLNPTGIYDILSGKSRSPKIETLAKIAAALGVPISILFDDRPDTSLRAEIEALFDRLPPDERRRLVQTARAWLESDCQA